MPRQMVALVFVAGGHLLAKFFGIRTLFVSPGVAPENEILTATHVSTHAGENRRQPGSVPQFKLPSIREPLGLCRELKKTCKQSR